MPAPDVGPVAGSKPMNECIPHGAKVNRFTGTFFSLMFTLLLSMTLFFAGCGGGSLGGSLERVEASVKSLNNAVQGATECIQALNGFDFENAAFLSDAMSAVRTGQDLVQAAGQALEDLSSIDYRGKLMRLGELVSEFVPNAREALDEVSIFYQDMEAILLAVRPLLEEEATITQLDIPQNQSEWRERLERLRRAVEMTIQSLGGLTVDPILSSYRSYFLELSLALEKVVDNIIDRLPLADIREDIGISAEFGRVQELLDAYPSLAEGLKGKLMIFSLDHSLGEIELEINRLYMESGS
ncbi:hypothetical protein [Candidatus Solincola tengchongensis]|uniref:hypothetical protein n=1 Tax=Candidatus Solincola tengchongensis TaxID=2900693 RepID=UPI00257DE26A|nr:hypothetical protein [Candidatus Solincola tengchongensis]